MADNRKSVLITGCSPGGIGHSLAREFHRNGLRVLATARDKSSLISLEEQGIETLSLVVDKEESRKACRDEVELLLKGKGLDYLVNNAGLGYTVPVLDVNLQKAREVFETNFISVIAMCQEFAPLIIKAKGTIVQIGSVAGIIPYVFGGVYNASKAALHSLSDSLRVELAPFGVQVTTIITGGVKSNIARTAHTLPETSLYQPVKAEYARRIGHSQEGALSNEAYARTVVTQILYGSAPLRWIRWLLLWPFGGRGIRRSGSQIGTISSGLGPPINEPFYHIYGSEYSLILEMYNDDISTSQSILH
ncbi:short chain dehydrogenase/reductase [Histoplasma capsulatum var. duboisii H88]|uniref:Short chain dehydrogenase/reductase n=1 Tax=Ajellomyces capsulatus (strain H88) TaxID=544711 RepID=F0UI91_AJEC8|nr:short chain dehydrogenase/reductase [Histoplasma capsulatum var. duboisii H88]